MQHTYTYFLVHPKEIYIYYINLRKAMPDIHGLLRINKHNVTWATLIKIMVFVKLLYKIILIGV